MVNYRTADNVSALEGILKDYNTLLDEFAIVQVQKGADLNTIQKASNDFLNRTRINNGALIRILDIYKTERSAIQPIGLLIRSILSDFLTFCYLVTYFSDSEEDQRSITNELNLLEKDFLKSMMEVIELESHVSEYNEAIPSVFGTKEEYNQHVSELKEQFKHLFKQDNTDLRFKKPNEFRSTSSSNMFDSKEEFSSGGTFMSEKQKWERMVRRGFKKYVTVFIGFKFFSQFQHYSKMSMEMLNEESEAYGFFHLILSVNAIFIVTDMQIQIVDGKESEYLTRLRSLVEQIDNIMSHE